MSWLAIIMAAAMIWSIADLWKGLKMLEKPAKGLLVDNVTRRVTVGSIINLASFRNKKQWEEGLRAAQAHDVDPVEAGLVEEAIAVIDPLNGENYKREQRLKEERLAANKRVLREYNIKDKK